MGVQRGCSYLRHPLQTAICKKLLTQRRGEGEREGGGRGTNSGISLGQQAIFNKYPCPHWRPVVLSYLSACIHHDLVHSLGSLGGSMDKLTGAERASRLFQGLMKFFAPRIFLSAVLDEGVLLRETRETL